MVPGTCGTISTTCLGTVRQPTVCGGIPFLVESLVILYNARCSRSRDRATVREHPWTWADMRRRQFASRGTPMVTARRSLGVGIGLRNAANIVMNLSIGYAEDFSEKRVGRTRWWSARASGTC